MNHDVFYEAMLARDYRFDGKFYIGVKTTGIYCRPICPAKPKRENVEFFLSATAAENKGYRPCLRCRPECAPLSPAWYGKTEVVQRALKYIAADGFFDLNEDLFADQFGVTARHLRRLFVEEVGQTPKQIAFNNRLNFARKLIVESSLPITTVAMSAGFSSLRRFNDAFKTRFQRVPTALRKKRDAVADKGIRLSLSYRPPLDWENLIGFYRAHQISGVDSVSEDGKYSRVFKIGKATGYVEVSNDSTQESQLQLRVLVDDPTVLFAVAQRVRRMFDLDSDPLLIANAFRTSKFLDSLYRKYPGLRIATAWDPFESAICTILGQLVSLTHARRLVAQLVRNYGEKTTHPVTGEDAFIFPTAAVLATVDLDEVKTTKARKDAIRAISKMVASGELELHKPQGPDAIREALLTIPGIGPWSAEYISLRALGNTDAFPSSDLVLKRALKLHPDMDLEKIRPWRSYAAIYLWKQYAQKLSKQQGE
jgi:AraC family transcriptional regulator, regulatory protein of adaptative response / DNA-3-methyladenine glycosylase II